MAVELMTVVNDFAECIKRVDARKPQAINVRSKETFRPGIGPHSEAQTVRMVSEEMGFAYPDRYSEQIAVSVPYPEVSRQKCDLCIGSGSCWKWAIEVKMLRMLGDNGKPNDNILMHILSPYPTHRSALTDCEKLLVSNLGVDKAILIYGYDHDEWPLETAIEAFEALAKTRAKLGPRIYASFDGLIHPIHRYGAVYAWRIEALKGV